MSVEGQAWRSWPIAKPIAISAGRGIACDLLDAAFVALEKIGKPPTDITLVAPMRVGVFGEPNVGKSTLLNSLSLVRNGSCRRPLHTPRANPTTSTSTAKARTTCSLTPRVFAVNPSATTWAPNLKSTASKNTRHVATLSGCALCARHNKGNYLTRPSPRRAYVRSRSVRRHCRKQVGLGARQGYEHRQQVRGIHSRALAAACVRTNSVYLRTHR